MQLLNNPSLAQLYAAIQHAAPREVPGEFVVTASQAIQKWEAGEVTHSMNPGYLTIKWYTDRSDSKVVMVYMAY